MTEFSTAIIMIGKVEVCHEDGPDHGWRIRMDAGNLMLSDSEAEELAEGLRAGVKRSKEKFCSARIGDMSLSFHKRDAKKLADMIEGGSK